MDGTAAWASFLDSLESELRGIERTPSGCTRAAPFLPPTGIGGLPGPLAERAREVLTHIEEAVRAVNAELREIESQLEERERLETRGPRSASCVDTHL